MICGGQAQNQVSTTKKSGEYLMLPLKHYAILGLSV